MKKINLWILSLFALLSYKNDFYAQNIVINEILTSNNVSIKDEDGSNQDWIELYNNGSSSVNLLGYGITDDPLMPFKWTFPNVSLGSGKYMIVWASDKNRTGSALHTNFKISADGENILLTNPSGVTVDQIAPVYLQPDISYGRSPNGTGTFVFFGTPTPNAINSTPAFTEALKPPQFSDDPALKDYAFRTSGFDLSITSSNSGTTILYTMDGSEPDENNLTGPTYQYKNQYQKSPGQEIGPFRQNSFQTFKYTAPVPITDRSSQPNKISNISTTYDFTPAYLPDGPIFKGTVIKAKVIKPGALSSITITKNYFISSKGKNRFTLPVLSISTDEDLLFDYTKGIYVAGKHFDDWRKANPSGTPGEKEGNFTLSGIDYEREANMSYFVDGKEMINQKLGIRIHGAFSRVFPCKSLNLYARSDYGAGNMSCKFFSDEPYANFERLTVRNYGSSNYNFMFRDALNAQLVKDLRLETEAYQPTILFINGEYWGVLELRERYDNNYFKQVYNIPNDQIDLLENDAQKIDEGDNVDYFDMYDNDIASKNLADDSNFKIVQTRMDTDNFTDYFISNIFFQNKDWPGNNIVFWRKKTNGFQPNTSYGHDGRWRWAIHDMDATYANYTFDSLAAATDANGPSIPNPSWSTLIIRKLLENNNFKIDFINRFADLLNTNFLSTRINAKIDSMAAVIAPEMNDQYFRWKAPVDASDWQYFLNQAKDFANRRPDFQRQHIKQKFGISKNINVTLDVSDASQGYIKINTINILDGTPGISANPYPWTGIYFHNIPLKLKAIAKPGFKFDHWARASNSTEAEITLTPTADFAITAVFVPTNTEASVPIYFWLMDSNIPNGDQLTSLNSTYELNADGVIQYKSCISGYPFPEGNPNYSKASMERRDKPTDLNYRPEANKNIVYTSSIIKGLQINEPLQKDGLENTLQFNISTFGYKKIKLSFAAVNEKTNASAISVDYAINPGTPVWITTGLSAPLTLTNSYKLFEIDFSNIKTADNNPDFKVRLRFTGSNMVADSGKGNRITFNNIAVDGVKSFLSYPSPQVFTVGTAIPTINPTAISPIVTYSVSPALPAGLALNTSTGAISGTPTVTTPISTYTITGATATGSFSVDIIITVESNLSIDAFGLKKFKIYPNPFSDLLNVTGISNNFSYRLISLDRKLIKKESNTSSPINLTGLPIGTYILELSSDDVTEIVKVVKNK